MQYDQCLFELHGEVHLTHCGLGEKANWSYEPETKQLIYKRSKNDIKCAQLGDKNKITKVSVTDCDSTNTLQRFNFNEIRST